MSVIMKPLVVVIVGPTASGKTKLAVELAKAYNGEVLSCDSMQIYRRMDIGTAKPTAEEMQGIPHHMIDVVEPDESFSVSRYVEMADPMLQDILSRGKRCIVCGGTGLYVDSLIAGRTFAPYPETGKRQELEKLAAAHPEIIVGKVEVTSDQENISIAASLGVNNIPAMFFYKDGKLAQRLIGYMTAEELEAKLGL
jgi:tRNA dimethylallyltransferase